MYEHNAELIYGKMRTFNNIKAAKNANKDDRKPFIVWLYGPPGSGKSSPTVQKVIHEELGLDTTNAVSISVDALVEGLEPFQRKSAELYRNKEEKYTNEQKQKLSQSLYAQAYKANKSGETIIDGKKIAEKDKKTLLKKRDDLFEKAVQYELDILYEFIPYSDKDYIKDKIFNVLEKNGKLDKYDVYVVYPFVNSKVLEERLEARPAMQMASSTPFFRYVVPRSGKTMLKESVYTFFDYIRPRVDPKNLSAIKDIFKLYFNYKVKDAAEKVKELEKVNELNNAKLNVIKKEQLASMREKLMKPEKLFGEIKKVVVFDNTISNSSYGGKYSRKAKLLRHRRKTLKKLSK
jgi:hypothetical protein